MTVIFVLPAAADDTLTSETSKTEDASISDEVSLPEKAESKDIDEASSLLKNTIDQVIELVNQYDVYDEGEYIPDGACWISSETYSVILDVISSAQDYLANENLHNASELDSKTMELVDAVQNTNSGLMVSANEIYDTYILFTSQSEEGKNVTVTSDDYYDLFDQNDASDAAECVKKIIKAGGVFINGFKLPADKDSFAEENEFFINEENYLTKTESGFSVNGTDYNDYYDACIAVLESIPSGNIVYLYDTDNDDKYDQICAYCMNSFIVGEINEENGNYTISRADVDYDNGFSIYESSFLKDTSITVNANYVSKVLAAGDTAFAYYSPEGWTVKRAIEINGVLMKSEDSSLYTIDGNLYEGISGTGDGSLPVSARAAEFFKAFSYFEYFNTKYRVSLWLMDTGDGSQGPAVAFTTGANASVFLENAITKAQAALDSVDIKSVENSAENAASSSGRRWVTQEEYDNLASAIKQANEALSSEKSSVEMDYNIYYLYKVIADSTDDIKSGVYGHGPDEDEGMSKSTMIIIFIIIIAVVLIAAALIITFLLLKRRKKTAQDTDKQNSDNI